ncbi:superoxide dismutase [Priestia filamentosa]|uniref:superoxide dismutase n=1 Tax=Priestia filamentosa TaxID=1402861 RepID=A0A1X7EQN3_9BACI|nr:superoxide dismutase [Priestia filamentosa]AKO93217.1 superoxide dismutase [Priestia filamentosa]MDT3763359.1 superoxide dismutase [Priestia filamentosa]OXS69917.1 superoxide dismutase [Priestia filamentosa]SMF38071.1 superoxide dismutase, Fe-Mn family [Priestia filamentosa]
MDSETKDYKTYLEDWANDLYSHWDSLSSHRKNEEEWHQKWNEFAHLLEENHDQDMPYACFERAKELYLLWEDAYEENERDEEIHHEEENHQDEEGHRDEVNHHGEKSRPAFNPVPIGGHTLPPLPYPYEALEPYIDRETMRLHHDKHHQTYVDGLNKAEKEMKKARSNGDFTLIAHWEREAAFHGAGHYLHTLFWNVMSPNGGGKPRGEIRKAIDSTFGGFERFKQQFTEAANKVEGSGWGVLVWAPRAHRVEILQAEKHQNLSQYDVIPLLALDVWEHSYYLKYQNDRKKYIENWWNVVNWAHVEERYREAMKVKWKPF